MYVLPYFTITVMESGFNFMPRAEMYIDLLSRLFVIVTFRTFEFIFA